MSKVVLNGGYNGSLFNIQYKSSVLTTLNGLDYQQTFAFRIVMMKI